MAGAGDTAQTYRQLGDVAARVALRLRGFDHPGSRLPLLWDINQAPLAARYAQHTSDPVQARLVEWALAGFASVQSVTGSLRTQVIHNDLNPHNIMISEDSDALAGIIDFGDSVHSTLVNDVAVACSYLIRETDTPLAPVVEFLKSYCPVMPLTEAELGVLPELIATRHMLTIVIGNWRAAQDPQNSTYILRNQNSSIRGLRCLYRLEPGYVREQILNAGSRGAW